MQRWWVLAVGCHQCQHQKGGLWTHHFHHQMMVGVWCHAIIDSGGCWLWVVISVNNARGGLWTYFWHYWMTVVCCQHHVISVGMFITVVVVVVVVVIVNSGRGRE